MKEQHEFEGMPSLGKGNINVEMTRKILFLNMSATPSLLVGLLELPDNKLLCGLFQSSFSI